MRHLRSGAFVGLFAMALGCADSVGPPGRAVPGGPLHRDEIPAEFSTSPSIFKAWVDTGFYDDQAYGQAFMQYFANRARQTVQITLRNKNGMITSNSGESEDHNLLPNVRSIFTTTSAAAPGTCGYIVDATSVHKAWHEVITQSGGWLSWGLQTISNSKSVMQPTCKTACSTVSPTQFQNASYDPYAEPGSDDDSCASGSQVGSGTQFNPGDYTGGETVDWNTGIGDGGTSACGLAAKVEYICIDEWDADTQTWKRYSCGYATTC